ncbi:type VI secretion system contractile sheath domain-containing protein [Agaribacterium sp. ZY112]|uniref:type VI secretion system contractile sheath domain-containing protein n=1 Tax=Agaribacterium sp. ZY112 TaxID=3233574 RepID=UPI003523F728
MPRATMQTSGAVFSDGQDHPIRPKATLTKPLRVAILGDFSGRSSRGISEPETIAKRRAYTLNKDNFERTFEDLGVQLKVPVMDEPLSLMEFDDLHPDYLYSRVPLFKQFIELNKQLLTPSKFDQAADEIKQWVNFQAQQFTSTGADTDAEEGQLMLDAILSSSNYQAQYASSPQGQIDQLIKDIVAPFVAPTADPRQADMLKAVTEATNDAMRKIMHQSDFQQIEASWRSLHMLMRRLDSHPELYIDIIDITKAELLADLAAAGEDLEQAQIFKRLVSSQTSSGNMPYNLVLGDFFIEDRVEDVALLIDMATIAQAVDGCFVSGGSTKLAGCPSVAGSADPDDWYYPIDDEFQSAWQALRAFDASEHLCLAAPRFLLRLPFGAKTASTDCFEFEELPETKGHKYYLWGNSAYLVTLQLCQSYLDFGSHFNPDHNPKVSDLPLHVYKEYGSQQIKPCAENLLTDSGIGVLAQAGLTAVRSVQNSDAVLINQFKSVSESGLLRGPWS